MKFTIVIRTPESETNLTEDDIVDMLKQGLVPANVEIISITPTKGPPPANLELLPPPPDVRSRFEQFKEIVFKFYKYINSGAAPLWDAGDAKQLKNLLKGRPELTKEEFREWLLNYKYSENVNFPDRPRKFLPNITSYANGPLDKYGKPLVEKKRRIL